MAIIKEGNYEFYSGISKATYAIEKRRLQIELLNMQEAILETGGKVVITFDGRDAAGKGSTIKRFAENMMPKNLRIVELGIPTPYESKNWFKRYERHLPKAGEIVFYDRSWYNRALIEPTMGYCTQRQYTYFMKKVQAWEEELIESGTTLIKFYLSVSKANQVFRFDDRIGDALKHWKYSENDEQVQKKWTVFTNYKKQMFERTSSEKSPWVVVNANRKGASRLSCMLYTINQVDYPGKKPFKPLAKVVDTFSGEIELDGIPFKGLNYRQHRLLENIKKSQQS